MTHGTMVRPADPLMIAGAQAVCPGADIMSVSMAGEWTFFGHPTAASSS